jgi:hypothetical protein
MNIKKKPNNKWAQFVPIGIPIDCWKTFSPTTTDIVYEEFQHLFYSVLEFLCIESNKMFG